MSGIFGIWGAQSSAMLAYHGLHPIQHRGKEITGISTLTPKGILVKRGKGIVNQVFSEADLHDLDGKAAIGIVSESKSYQEETRPCIANTRYGQIAIVYNGLISNRNALKKEIEKEGGVFSTDSEAETILHKYARSKGSSIEDRITRTFIDVGESYAAILMTEKELVGIRGPYGINPLEVGMLKEDDKELFVLASESIAIRNIGGKHLRAVNPGELIIVDDSGLRTRQIFQTAESSPCILEHVYFGHPASRQFNNQHNNSTIRIELGRQLFREHPLKADVVVPVSDASNYIAMGFSRESGINYGAAGVRSHYVGSGFVNPPESKGISKMSRKLTIDEDTLNGNRVVYCDEFTLTGETFKELVEKSRDLGAREVHLRVAFPPYMNHCYLGKQSQKKTDLIANKMPIEEMRQYFKADSLAFLSEQGLLQNPYLKGRNHCTYCFSGKQPFVQLSLEK